MEKHIDIDKEELDKLLTRFYDNAIDKQEMHSTIQAFIDYQYKLSEKVMKKVFRN